MGGSRAVLPESRTTIRRSNTATGYTTGKTTRSVTELPMRRRSGAYDVDGNWGEQFHWSLPGAVPNYLLNSKI